MKIEFYFDPSCPFSWVTSRWLLLVSGEREIDIDWKPFSLALKNDQLELASDDKYVKAHQNSHRALRVMMAARESSGARLIDLYTSFGINHHVAGFEIDENLLSTMLSDCNQPAELMAASDDNSYDQILSESIKQATDIAGQDIGVPTIVFINEKNQKQGFFGPVLQELPEKSASLDIWDGLSKLASSSSFYELKRARPDGLPDIGSTARC